MSDIGIGITVGAALASSVASVVGGSVRHVDRLRKAVDAAESAAQDVAGYRKTAAALRAADERTAALRREMEQTGKPTRTLRRDFARAGAESRRLATRLGSQSRALKEAGVDVRRLGVEERRLNRTLREQRAALDNVEAAMRRRDAARGRREAARGSMVEAGALAYAAVRPLQAVVGAAVEFEEKMADVGKVVDFAAPDGLRLMGRDIRRLSKEIPVAAAGIADIVAAAGQAGVAQTREELLEFATDTAKVAVAFDLTGAAAGDAMAGVRKVFGLGQAAAMDLAGAYNHLSNNLGASAPGLLKVGEVAGSNAQLIGLSARQLAALGTTLLDLKTPPAEAATALNSMFTKFANIETSTKDAQKALESVGLSASGLKRALRQDAETAIVAFFEAVSKADNQAEVLSAIFGEDHGPKAAKIATGLETYAKARRLASAEQANAASVMREYEVRSATTANAQTLFANRLNDLSIAVGDALLPGLNTLMDLISPVVDGLALLADRFPIVTTAVVSLTAGVILAKVGLIAYRYAAGGAGEALATLKLGWERALPVRKALTSATGRATAMLRSHVTALAGVPAVGNLAATGLGRATVAVRVFRMALVSTGVGALVLAIGLAAQWLMANWEPVKAFFAGVGRGIGAALDAMGPVGDVLRGIGTVIGDFLGWIGSLFAPVEASAETMERWGKAGEAVGAVIGLAFRTALAPVMTVVGWAQKGLAVYRAWRGLGDAQSADEAPASTTAGAAVKKTVAAGAIAAAAAGGATFGAAAAPTQDVVPAGANFAAITPGSAPAATTSSGRSGVSVQVTAHITVQPPAGADEQEIAREVARQLADAMRRAAVEARLGESDG